MSVPADPERAASLTAALDLYRAARRNLLETLDLPLSNRDPLAEYAEHLAAALLGGRLADSRVQKGYDLVLSDGEKVQVRYVANTSAAWVNEHLVHTIPEVGRYALVIFEGFEVVGVVVFPLINLAPVGSLLGKRHPGLDQQLQFTARNWRTIRDNRTAFEGLGVEVWVPPFGG